MTDQILKKIADGDATAVDQCISTYKNLIWSMARRWCPEEAEDMVQEIFIEIWKNASRFDSAVANEKTFIAMIARRRLIDRLRKHQSRPETRISAEILEGRPDESGYHPDHGVDAARATEIMKELDPQQQHILKLSLHLGLSHGEIARVTDLALGTVKSHIRRGLALVRQKLTQPPGLASGNRRGVAP